MASPVRLAEYAGLPPNAVGSTNVADVRYNPETRRLFVAFKREGRIYAYENVPEGTFRGFLSAPSKGQYVYYVIRGKGSDSVYAYDQIN